jgi:Holliday junction DNA helicase RuvA
MISIISGNLTDKSSNDVIIDCNGLGLHIFISVYTAENLPALDSPVKLYTYLSVKEDSLDLFGFSDKIEKNAFLQLIKVSKIGPKTAIGILSAVNPQELVEFIVTSNHKALSKLPGIGPKTAERIVVELRDKFKDVDFTTSSGSFNKLGVASEAVAALMSLGYNKAKAEKSVDMAIREIAPEDLKLERLIKSALKNAIA